MEVNDLDLRRPFRLRYCSGLDSRDPSRSRTLETVDAKATKWLSIFVTAAGVGSRPGNPFSRSLRRPRMRDFPLAAAIRLAAALLYSSRRPRCTPNRPQPRTPERRARPSSARLAGSRRGRNPRTGRRHPAGSGGAQIAGRSCVRAEGGGRTHHARARQHHQRGDVCRHRGRRRR